MFATLLRRWRLGVPLALVSLFSMMVAGGVLTPAAAHPATGRLHFAFAGDAAGMVDLNVFPSFIECFSGAIEDHGVNLDAIAIKESGCPNENLDSVDVDPATGTPLPIAHADATEARIISDHTKTEGHVITDVINFGEAAIIGHDDAVECFTPVTDGGQGFRTPQECIAAGFTDVTAGDFAHVRAEAECEKKHGRVAGHASAQALSSFDDLDMEFGDGGVRELKPTAFTFTGGSVTYVTTTAGDVESEVLVLIVNESSVLKSDDFAAISANALHFVEQNAAGGIVQNILFAHAYAQIHCHSGTFSFEDPIGA